MYGVSENSKSKGWNDLTFSSSCTEYIWNSNSDYQYNGETGDGIYKVFSLI